MKLDRLTYEPGTLVDFYEHGLSSLGALCERTWHDRLQVVAEGAAARLWNNEGALHEIELAFVPADAVSARDPLREVFPGCPLTFGLASALHPVPLPLERVVLQAPAHSQPPDESVAEKRWRAEFPRHSHWRLASPFKPDFHFSLITLARCEIQAIDQHWSLHRLAIALPGGEPDESLSAELEFVDPDPQPPEELCWPAVDLSRWQALLRTALDQALTGELAGIRHRQENFLRRELERIDEYFQQYERELESRAARTSNEATKLKAGERLAAAKAEHARRRSDQVARHEILIHAHLDAVILVAETAWRASVRTQLGHQIQTIEASFVPRCRRWFHQG